MSMGSIPSDLTAYTGVMDLFRGRYKAILVDADEYLAAVVRYIHLNPVGAGIVYDNYIRGQVFC
jgi:hypothetical protein